MFFKKTTTYISFIIITLSVYTIFGETTTVNSNEDFLLFDFCSDKINFFYVEIYNEKNELKFKKELFFNADNSLISFNLKEDISNSDIVHITFSQKGIIKFNNIKIKQNRNLLSIGFKDFEDYFLINKNIHIEEGNMNIKLHYPGKGRLIMKALTNKMINLR